MDPLLASDSTAAAALGAANAHRIATPSTAEWTEAMAVAAAPQTRNQIAPAAAKRTDGATRDFSVADAVARAMTQLAVATPVTAKTGAAASAGAQAKAGPDGETTSLCQPTALTSAASDTAAASSLGATGRRSATAEGSRSSSLSKTPGDAAQGADRQPQFAAQPENTSDRGVHTVETDSGDGPQHLANAGATPRPAGATARRSTRGSLEKPSTDRVPVSSPAAAAITAAVLTTQPLQTSVSPSGGLPSVPARPAASRSTVGGGLGGSALTLSGAGLEGRATASISTDTRSQTPEASAGAKAPDDTGEAALADAGDPVATPAMAQLSGESASSPRLLPTGRPGPAAHSGPTAQAAAPSTKPGSAVAANAMPLRGKAASGPSGGGDPSGADTATAPATETVQPTASATMTSATFPPGSNPQPPTTAASQPKDIASVSPPSPLAETLDRAITIQAVQAARTVSQAEATNVATTMAPGSPLQASPDGTRDAGRKAGSLATTAAATTASGAGTTAPSAAPPSAEAAGPASAAAGHASTADRVDDAASRPGGATRSASAAAAPSAGGTVIARPSTQGTMTAMQGSAGSAGTPPSASGLIAGSQTSGSQTTGITPATGSLAGGAGPTTTPTGAAAPLGYTPATPDAMAASIVAMYRSGQSSLVLRLDPPGLGTVSVHLALGGNADVNVLFVPAVAQTAHLLQTGLGDLRQAMAASGLTLGQAMIGGGAGGGAGGGTSANQGRQSGTTIRTAMAVAPTLDSAPPDTAARGARAIA
jgi:flagellar hook-length control protein FliK